MKKIELNYPVISCMKYGFLNLQTDIPIYNGIRLLSIKQKLHASQFRIHKNNNIVSSCILQCSPRLLEDAIILIFNLDCHR